MNWTFRYWLQDGRGNEVDPRTSEQRFASRLDATNAAIDYSSEHTNVMCWEAVEVTP